MKKLALQLTLMAMVMATPVLATSYITITVLPEKGEVNYQLMNRPTTLKDIGTTLSKIAALDRSQLVVIKIPIADSDVPVGVLLRVLATVKNAGLHNVRVSGAFEVKGAQKLVEITLDIEELDAPFLEMLPAPKDLKSLPQLESDKKR